MAAKQKHPNLKKSSVGSLQLAAGFATDGADERLRRSDLTDTTPPARLQRASGVICL